MLNPGDTFIDIGANIGMASLAARRAIGETGTIYAFEPNPKVISVNREALKRNGIRNVRLHEAVLTDSEGTVELFVPLRNHGEATIGTPPNGAEVEAIEVAAVSGATLSELSAVHLIKIDVEGHELTVLRSIREVLETKRPPVICELMSEHLRRFGTLPSDILQLMTELDYRCFDIRSRPDGLFRTKAALARLERVPDDVSGNVLLVPAERAGSFENMAFKSLPK